MGFILELKTLKNDGINISLIFLPVQVKHGKFVQVGEEHHLIVAKISKANVLKTTDLIFINVFHVNHFCSFIFALLYRDFIQNWRG